MPALVNEPARLRAGLLAKLLMTLTPEGITRLLIFAASHGDIFIVPPVASPIAPRTILWAPVFII